MAPSIRIKMLGRFDIRINEKSIEESLGKTKKGQALIQYLLLHRQELTPNHKLCEALWPGDQSSNPENALKTLVSRVRSLLASCDERLGACIITERSAYRWNNELDICVDLFDFERLCKELKNVSKLTNQVAKKFDEAQELYTGDLLSGIAHEEWVVSRSAHLHNEYLRMAHQYVTLLREREAYDAVIRVCRTALDVDAFDEELHVALMDALVKTNRNNEALLQYKHVTNMHMRYLDVQPPEGIRNFYKQIVRTGQTLDSDIDGIAADLQDYEEPDTAFVCEYSVFKEFYHLQLRALERSGQVVFLALIMVNSTDYQPIEPLRLDETMKDLQEVLSGNLRKGDIIARFGASKYALVLSCDTCDRGRMVMERVKRAFYQVCDSPSIRFQYRISVMKEMKRLFPRASGKA